jgi:hypothetical protein
MNRLAEVLAREEIMEKQHSRIHWLKAGAWNIGVSMRKLNSAHVQAGPHT